MENKYFNLRKLAISKSNFRLFSMKKMKDAGFDTRSSIAIRGEGKYKNKAFYLSHTYNWKIIKDELGVTILIPTKKIK